MKRYLIFAGPTDYAGGWGDFYADSDTVQEAISFAEEAFTIAEINVVWAHVADTKSQNIVWEKTK